MNYLKFENIRSKDEFLKRIYFNDLNTSMNKNQLEEYLNHKIELMEMQGILSDGCFELDDENKIIKIKSKKRGINFSIVLNSDISEVNSFTIINPLGKGGKAGVEYGVGLYKSSIYNAFLEDRFGNKFSLSKSVDTPIIGEKNFKLEENSMSYTFSLFQQLFSISSSKSLSTVTDKNINKEQLAHTGTSIKTSLSHVYRFNNNHGLYGKLNTEISLPKLSTYPFFKPQLFISKIIPLNYFDISIQLDGSFGGIFGKDLMGSRKSNQANQGSMIPINDRFFNGKDYNFPGFVNSSISGSRSTPFLGNSIYYTARFTLLKRINEQANGILYYHFGGSSLSLGSAGNNNIISNTLSDLKSIRSSIGFGLNVNMGKVDLNVSLVKPLKHKSGDHLENFSFEMNFNV